LKNNFNIENNVIILTGGSGNLGSIYAEYLISNGAKVCNFDLTSPQDINKFDEKNYLFLKTDVTDKENISDSLKLVLEKFGCPQGLINNAALDSPPGDSDVINGPFEDYPEEAWDKVIDVNLKSIFLTCQIIGKEMADNSGGSIINISSHYGLISPDQRIYNYRKNFYKPISYSASKSGIFNITRYLSTYWGQQNVRVNSLTLGGVFDNQDEEFVNNYSEKVPLGRMAEKHEYNGVIHFLLSDASSYITGSNIVSDGGWTAW
tara:strand:- start:1040 stop:1825 length:786 start_codon:yes stop_codon:yes gene_type:complete